MAGDGAELGEAVGGGLGADAFVLGDALAAVVLLVADFLGGERGDLALEPALLGGFGGPLVGLGGEAVLLSRG